MVGFGTEFVEGERDTLRDRDRDRQTDREGERERETDRPVSYTHLTLPTNHRV